MLLFLFCHLLFDFIYLLSSDESDPINDESDDDGSDSGSSGTYYFPNFLVVYGSVGSVNGLGSGIFAPTGVESKCLIFVFIVFVPTGVKSKSGRLVKMFCCIICGAGHGSCGL